MGRSLCLPARVRVTRFPRSLSLSDLWTFGGGRKPGAGSHVAIVPALEMQGRGGGECPDTPWLCSCWREGAVRCYSGGESYDADVAMEREAVLGHHVGSPSVWWVWWSAWVQVTPCSSWDTTQAAGRLHLSVCWVCPYRGFMYRVTLKEQHSTSAHTHWPPQVCPAGDWGCGSPAVQWNVS
ncbi:hypothetical protein O3P69_002460 [Scylla paramamosain]|uniref:Uncharacterized protein n=2 Tax=Scylla paramamosain TaxID=85552 RepID=A0AAW0UKI7_SCYPA